MAPPTQRSSPSWQRGGYEARSRRSGPGSARSKNTLLAAQYRRLAARRGHSEAVAAVAHSILVAVWHMLQTGEIHQDPGADYFARRDPERLTPRLLAQLERLGHTVIVQTQAEAAYLASLRFRFSYKIRCRRVFRSVPCTGKSSRPHSGQANRVPLAKSIRRPAAWAAGSNSTLIPAAARSVPARPGTDEELALAFGFPSSRIRKPGRLSTRRDGTHSGRGGAPRAPRVRLGGDRAYRKCLRPHGRGGDRSSLPLGW